MYLNMEWKKNIKKLQHKEKRHLRKTVRIFCSLHIGQNNSNIKKYYDDVCQKYSKKLLILIKLTFIIEHSEPSHPTFIAAGPTGN